MSKLEQFPGASVENNEVQQLSDKQESFYQKNKHKLQMLLAGILFGGSVGAASYDSISHSRETNSDPEKMKELKEMKDIRKLWGDQEKDLKDQIQNIDQAHQ